MIYVCNMYPIYTKRLQGSADRGFTVTDEEAEDRVAAQRDEFMTKFEKNYNHWYAPIPHLVVLVAYSSCLMRVALGVAYVFTSPSFVS